MRDAMQIARDAQADAGWTDSTLLGVVLDYIESQQANSAFEDYLCERAGQENQDESGE